jgi:hypothetical protein
MHVAAELVRAGLWQAADGGWQIVADWDSEPGGSQPEGTRPHLALVPRAAGP